MPTMNKNINKEILAYIIGVALGDGNLSNPNGRAIRLRISCDTKYKRIIKEIISSLEKIFPDNKVSIVKRTEHCIDISCYSNKLEDMLGWKVGYGSKEKQKVSIPKWIKRSKKYKISCLRGLFETDGSVYIDRKYLMANFVTIIPTLASDVLEIITDLGFRPNRQLFKAKNGKIKHTIRISKNTTNFIRLINIRKD
jgi:DNA-binding transcriptional regulator WhiA